MSITTGDCLKDPSAYPSLQEKHLARSLHQYVNADKENIDPNVFEAYMGTEKKSSFKIIEEVASCISNQAKGGEPFRIRLSKQPISAKMMRWEARILYKILS